MLERMRRVRISPAMVVATIALVGAFGGSAIADQAVDLAKSKLFNGKRIKARSISAGKIKRNTLGGTEINESKLGTVPKANKASSADTLGGTSASGFVKTGASAGGDLTGSYPSPTFRQLTLHTVGDPGEPALQNSWTNATSFGNVRFSKDPYGVVRLYGAATHTGAVATTIFTLPAGFRPAYDVDLAAGFFGPAAGVVGIDSGSGNINPISGATSFVQFEGLTFQAGG